MYELRTSGVYFWMWKVYRKSSEVRIKEGENTLGVDLLKETWWRMLEECR